MKNERPPFAPLQWPPTDFRVPQLWQRAEEMFGVLIVLAGSIYLIATMRGRALRPRLKILALLVPVEKIVRELLTIEAITWLLMTPRGQKLMRETPKSDVPAPPAPPRGFAAMAAPATVSEADPGAATESPPDTHPVTFHHFDIENWTCSFRVLGWVFPDPPEADRDSAPAGEARPRIMLLDSAGATVTEAPVTEATVSEARVREAARAEALPQAFGHEHPVERQHAGGLEPWALRLARRAEALRRVIENPVPAIRRLARLLATLPSGVLEGPNQYSTPSLWWWHGRREWLNICTLAERPVAIFNTWRPHIEPG